MFSPSPPSSLLPCFAVSPFFPSSLLRVSPQYSFPPSQAKKEKKFTLSLTRDLAPFDQPQTDLGYIGQVSYRLRFITLKHEYPGVPLAPLHGMAGRGAGARTRPGYRQCDRFASAIGSGANSSSPGRATPEDANRAQDRRGGLCEGGALPVIMSIIGSREPTTTLHRKLNL